MIPTQQTPFSASSSSSSSSPLPETPAPSSSPSFAWNFSDSKIYDSVSKTKEGSWRIALSSFDNAKAHVYRFASRVFEKLSSCFAALLRCFRSSPVQAASSQQQTPSAPVHSPATSSSTSYETPHSPLLDFYRGTAPNSEGKTFDQILNMTDEELQATNNYSQWLFPLCLVSKVNPKAPSLQDIEIKAFHTEPLLKERLLQAFQRMLKFYGLFLGPETHQIHPTDNSGERQKVWLTKDSPYFQTITRILWSLTLLGLNSEATAFKNALVEVDQNKAQNTIPSNTLKDWASFAGLMTNVTAP